MQNTTSLDQATDYLLRQPSFLLGGISLGLGGALGGGLGGGEQDELARALAMSLGENVMVSTDPTSETNDGRSREDQVHSTIMILSKSNHHYLMLLLQ